MTESHYFLNLNASLATHREQTHAGFLFSCGHWLADMMIFPLPGWFSRAEAEEEIGSAEIGGILWSLKSKGGLIKSWPRQGLQVSLPSLAFALAV